jgi:hypothetical protein
MKANDRIEAKMKTIAPRVSTYEQALASWPIFGGTSAEGATTTTDTGKDETVTIEGKIVDKSDSDGGNTETETEIVNPADPEAISKLTKQIEQANAAAQAAVAEANKYKEKEQQAARAQQTKEEQLQTDLDNAMSTIQQQDAVIKNSAVTNALLANKGYEWHSVRQVIAELQDGEYSVDIDFDSGQAVVTGIEDAAKRIAKDCPWLVSKDKAADQSTAQGGNNGNGTRVRGSGTPPRPPGNQPDKTARRAELSKRFPVIAR